jgi:heme-degrading monooxygenase HmoA
MIAVIFEVVPHEAHKAKYLDLAGLLGPLLQSVDGFISIERFTSLSTPGKILSLSYWQDEESVTAWRNSEEHRAAQSDGRRCIFETYRLRVAVVLRDYGHSERDQAPRDSRTYFG